MYEVREFFDKHAAVWDKSIDHSPEKIRTMLQLSDIQPHSVILDVGCGTGILEPYLLEHGPSVILAVDFAASMIAEAEKKLRHEAVRFLCADIMDVQDLKFDRCFVYNTLPHFPEPQQVIDHLSMLLCPGGRITISHTRGRRLLPDEHPGEELLPPAYSIVKMLEQDYRVDSIVDSNALLLVSALRK